MWCEWLLVVTLCFYAAAVVRRIPARMAASLGAVGAIAPTAVPPVAVALFVVSPVVVPCAVTFMLLSPRPATAAWLARLIGVTRVHPSEAGLRQDVPQGGGAGG